MLTLIMYNRYKDAELYHLTHYHVALRRGDLHGLAVASGNIGFLKYYDPEQYEKSVVLQAMEYSLAEKVGDFARMGIAFNKIGKLYTTLGHYEEAVKMFQVAIQGAKQAQNLAGEGMAWGNLGTVYRALGRFHKSIECHVIYRENAAKRLDVGGIAIMQHQLAMDYLLKGDLLEAEESILDSFQTLEKIRSQIGEEDESKISNFEKNQAEAHNLLQVLLVAQGKHKEAFILSDRSRARALSEIVQKRLSSFKTESDHGSDTGNTGSLELDPAFIEDYFSKAVLVSQKLSTTLVTYSIVTEFGVAGNPESWVYSWVLAPSGGLHFNKARLDATLDTKVEVREKCIISLRGSLGKNSQLQAALRSLQPKKVPTYREAKNVVLDLQSIQDLEGIEEILFSEEVVLAEPAAEHSESFETPVLNAGKWNIHTDRKSQGLRETSLGNSGHENSQEKATAKFPKDCLLSCTDGSIYHETHEVAKVKSFLTEDSSTQKSISPRDPVHSPCEGEPVSQEDSSNPQTVISPDLDAHFPYGREFISQEASSNQKPVTPPDPNVHIPCEEKSVVVVESCTQESVTPSALDADIPCERESIGQEDSTAQNTVQSIDQKCSSTHKPVTSPDPDVHTACEGKLIAQEDSSMQKPESPPYLDADTPCEKPLFQTKSSTQKPADPDVHAPCEGESIGKKISSAQGPVTELGVPGPIGDVAVRQESIQRPVHPLQYGELVEEDPLKDSSSQRPASNKDGASSAFAMVEVAAKIEGCDPAKEAGISDEQSEDAEKESTEDAETENWQPMLNSLYKILIEPIRDHFPSQSTQSPRVTFIPQDFLLKVPFAALCEDGSDSYFVQNFVISTSPSIHLLDLTFDYLSNLQGGTGPGELSLLAIGNPKMPFKDFPPLPAAEQEVRMIAEILDCPRNEVALYSRATKKHVTSIMSNFKILHFATHAVVDVSDAHGDFTLRGFIVLARSDEYCNGLLMAEEVRRMNLKAELVVLSCCDTGLGKVTGDGVLGK